MQQQIARETKRDSSAMKSISLLTMIFLPATAIAVSFSYFMRLRANRILSQVAASPFLRSSSKNSAF
jgi:hypothetical protein